MGHVSRRGKHLYRAPVPSAMSGGGTVVALIASHDRRESTLLCLERLMAQPLQGWQVRAVLVDDGSCDGTGAAVATAFQGSVEVVYGSGEWFWARSMAVAE